MPARAIVPPLSIRPCRGAAQNFLRSVKNLPRLHPSRPAAATRTDLGAPPAQNHLPDRRDANRFALRTALPAERSAP